VNCLLSDKSIELSDCAWPIHPGGKAIIEGVASALNLNKEALKDTMSVLANYGNMSSATFLFVLHQSIQRPSNKLWSVGLGFGPGLSFEGVLLENCYAKS